MNTQKQYHLPRSMSQCQLIQNTTFMNSGNFQKAQNESHQYINTNNYSMNQQENRFNNNNILNSLKETIYFDDQKNKKQKNQDLKLDNQRFIKQFTFKKDCLQQDKILLKANYMNPEQDHSTQEENQSQVNTQPKAKAIDTDIRQMIENCVKQEFQKVHQNDQIQQFVQQEIKNYMQFNKLDNKNQLEQINNKFNRLDNNISNILTKIQCSNQRQDKIQDFNLKSTIEDMNHNHNQQIEEILQIQNQFQKQINEKFLNPIKLLNSKVDSIQIEQTNFQQQIFQSNDNLNMGFNQLEAKMLQIKQDQDNSNQIMYDKIKENQMVQKQFHEELQQAQVVFQQIQIKFENQEEINSNINEQITRQDENLATIKKELKYIKKNDNQYQKKIQDIFEEPQKEEQMSIISEVSNEDNDMVYQLDSEGFLLNENHQHILDKNGQKVKLNNLQIQKLKDAHIISDQ